MSEANKAKIERLSFAEKVTLYLTVLALIVSSIYNSCAIHQNSQNIETAKVAFQISIEPTIDIIFPEKEYGSHVTIQNTSSIVITNIKIFPICYNIKKENESFKIINRQPLESVNLQAESLKPGQQSQVSLNAASCSQLPKTTGDYINSLVIVFHRQIDNKRFVKIEPFIMSASESNPDWASSFYSDWGGDPSLVVGLTGKIKETEEIIFRVDK
jgi:hypothetical protein